MLFEDRGTGRRADLVFRPFCPGDGESFRRCIQDFYGDGYPYREYLEEDFLLEQCASGKMLVLCGVAEEGEIVSTSAVRLGNDFQGSALLMLRVVKEAYRGMGVGRAQEERLFALAERREGLSSLYADVMTHDDVSQGSLSRRGFVHCGIRLMLYRNAVMVSRLALAEDGKMSQAVMCRRGDVEDVGALYCHSEHAEEVCRIYRKLGVSCGIEDGEALPVRDRTVMSWKKEPLHHSGICRIRRVGRDFSGILEQERWIIDGNYQRTLELRLQACEAVFLVDYPLEVCLAGASSRIGQKREDFPWIETEFDEEFRQWILDFPQYKLPEIYKLLEQHQEGKQIVILHSRQEADHYFEPPVSAGPEKER